MSNLLKSKFFLGVMIVAVMLTGAFALTADAQTTTVTAPAFTYSGLMKVGMSGPGISTLQAALNSVNTTTIVVDGAFGPATKAAVMQFQMSKGLTADGVVGPMTGQALANATIGIITVPGGLPAGCTSASGYSVTTGMPCTGANLPAGCTSTAGYSPTTGAKCDSGSTGGSTGPLTGGAGSITIEGLSKYSNEEVGEGQEDAEVLAFEVEADDESDIEVTSVKVELMQNTGADSEDLDDYAESVSIWFGGEMVGEADADEFSENSDVWTKSISLDGAVIEAGETEEFVVAITALGNLDSGDIDTDDWHIGVSDVRFVDGEGVVTTEDTGLDIDDATLDEEVEVQFDFEDFASANDVELEADLTDENPEEGVALGDANDTEEVLMLVFEFTADGSDINVESLEFDITSSGADTNEVASELMLKWGDDEQSESIPDANATTDDIVFDDLDLDIEDGDTLEFEVWATLQEVDGAPLVNGDTFKVDLDRSETEATDESGEDLTDGTEMTGTANGETQHIFTEAAVVEFVSADIDPVDNGDAASESATAELVFDVTAVGGTIYLNGDSETTDADEAFGVIAVGADTLAAYEFVVSGDYEITNSGADNEYYTVDEGDTMRVKITATITQGAAGTVLGGIALDEVQFGTVSTDQTTRSANVMNWSDLLDDLVSPKATLVGI